MATTRGTTSTRGVETCGAEMCGEAVATWEDSWSCWFCGTWFCEGCGFSTDCMSTRGGECCIRCCGEEECGKS